MPNPVAFIPRFDLSVVHMKRMGIIHVGLLAALLSAPLAADAKSPTIASLERKDWGGALSASSGHGALNTFVRWHYYKHDSSGARFDEIVTFIRQHPDWPDQNVLRLRAEKAAFAQRPDAAAARAFLSEHPPISGYGLMVQARLGMGDVPALVRQGWKQGDFERVHEGHILESYDDILNAADHQTRIERLLLQDLTNPAERLLSFVPSERKKLYEARIALIRMDRSVDAKLKAVPSSLMGDNGLLYDRMRWRLKKGMESGALELLRQMSANSPYAGKAWKARAMFARDYIERRRYHDAEALLLRHGPLEGADLADALFMLGWVQLEYLEKPSSALPHFKKLFESVQFPVSKSRGAYWTARTYDALGQKDNARQWYEKASIYLTTYYGQLAYAHLFPGKPLKLPPEPIVSDSERGHFLRSPMAQVIEFLVKSGHEDYAAPLFAHMGNKAKSPQESQLVADLARDMKLTFYGVRASKYAIQKNIMLFKAGWPTTHINRQSLEPALPHAIARQESEFNKEAVSSANARGLMQLLPATAQQVSRKLDMPYSLPKLFEPSYNATLGSKYLGDLVDGFSGSYVLAIAGYNAGPGRSREWTGRFGRPGRTVRDTINWVEMIPFSETRNYVQRVLENVQVYRAIMKPDTPLGIEKDLTR